MTALDSNLSLAMRASDAKSLMKLDYYFEHQHLLKHLSCQRFKQKAGEVVEVEFEKEIASSWLQTLRQMILFSVVLARK